MNRDIEPMERSGNELKRLAVGCLALWTVGAGLVLGNNYLAAAGAAVMLFVVTTFFCSKCD